MHHYEVFRTKETFAKPLRPRFYASLVTGLLFFFRLDAPFYFRLPGAQDWQNFSPACVLLPTSEPLENLVYGRFGVLRVIFQPGKLFRLLGAPLSELKTAVPLADLDAGSPLIELPERLAEARDDDAWIKMVEEVLYRQLRWQMGAPDLMDRLNGMLHRNRTVNLQVQTLSEKCGLSTRQLQRRFLRDEPQIISAYPPFLPRPG